MSSVKGIHKIWSSAANNTGGMLAIHYTEGSATARAMDIAHIELSCVIRHRPFIGMNVVCIGNHKTRGIEIIMCEKAHMAIGKTVVHRTQSVKRL